MLQSMREKAKSWVTFIIVGIITFMMAITGLETLAPNPNNPDVATVNGEDITLSQFNQSLDQQRRLIIQQMGNKYDPVQIDEKTLKDKALNTLIDQTLLLQAAKNSSMGFSQTALDKMILSMPEFQVKGKFDQDRFIALIRNAGMSPIAFRDLLHNEALMTQLQSGIAGTEFMTKSEINKLIALEQQKRDITWLTLKAEPARNKITPTNEQIEDYYQSNAQSFMTPEQVIVQYIELNKASVTGDLQVSEQDIRSEYERRIQNLKEQTQRQSVSAILIKTGDKRTLAEAQARAKEVLAKLKSGSKFAELAKEFSDDPASASKGGNLGFVQPGLFGEAFDKALASLKVGQVSEPVDTKFGVQILKLDDRESAKVPAYNTLKSEIAESLKTQEANSLFIDKTRELADVSFEASDLEQPAEKLGLKIHTLSPFSREGGTGIAENKKVIAAAFSSDVMDMGLNSDVIDITPEKAVVLRVSKHLKPEPKLLKDVQKQIVQSIKQEKANQELQAETDQWVAALEKGKSLDDVAATSGLTWQSDDNIGRIPEKLPRVLVDKAFTLPHPENGKPSFGVVELSNGDFAIVGVTKVHLASEVTNPEQNRLMAMFLTNAKSNTLFDEYIQSLKDQAKIKIHPHNQL